MNAGKTLHIRHLSEECRSLLDKAGNLVEVNIMEDPHYHIADDRRVWGHEGIAAENGNPVAKSRERHGPSIAEVS